MLTGHVQTGETLNGLRFSASFHLSIQMRKQYEHTCIHLYEVYVKRKKIYIYYFKELGCQRHTPDLLPETLLP